MLLRNTLLATLLLAVGLASAAAEMVSIEPAAQPVADRETLRSPFPDDYDVIEATEWRLIRLSMDLSHGGRCDIALLRPLPWIDYVGAAKGGSVHLHMPEMGVSGAARVLAIEPCPEFSPPKPGSRPVIGKFVTTNAKVIELSIEGLDKPIGTTASHPFWSLDRKGWGAAGDLRSGEKLRTQDGSTTVKSITLRPGTETVYNIEVHKDHTFYVSDAKLWVHNTCTKAQVRDLAKYWKLDGPKAHPALGRYSHGQEWFTDGRRWYTFDVDGHRGGVWKVFDRQGNRLHTVDIDGNIVGG